MKYLAVLGRQPEISKAELEALLFDENAKLSFAKGTKQKLLKIEFAGDFLPQFLKIERLGGVLKLAVSLEENLSY